MLRGLFRKGSLQIQTAHLHLANVHLLYCEPVIRPQVESLARSSYGATTKQDVKCKPSRAPTAQPLIERTRLLVILTVSSKTTPRTNTLHRTRVPVAAESDDCLAQTCSCRIAGLQVSGSFRSAHPETEYKDLPSTNLKYSELRNCVREFT
jgi:hypothetical protein